MSVTRELYKFGASSIASLQSRLPNSDGFFFTITKVSDPAYAFSVLVPLAAGIHTLLAADLLVASLVAEWSNTLLKWLLMEDRPYWWVREVELTGLRTPTLRQTPLTCETGPGSPSGHVMGATAVMYVLREWIEHYYIIPHEDLSDKKKRALNLLSWTFLIWAVVFVSLSRLYVATHFPHQCVLGFFFGLMVGRLLVCKTSAWTWWWRRGSWKRLLCISALLTSISISAYWFQRALGIDPQWSVRLAFKWCEHAEYLHVDTTPLYSLVRDSGAAIGVALSSPVHSLLHLERIVQSTINSHWPP
ncbi:hypothetical protein R5R35_009589 [Gryllus longicercus]|uniref:glucose-6-phosphatase n=1 Tax=Gryllus longicercus TaxID=2509291 RepID=A0AAN9YW88_9ORTH